jgi:hypothetical protein
LFELELNCKLIIENLMRLLDSGICKTHFSDSEVSDIIPPNMDCGGKGRTLEEMIEALHEIFEGDHVEVETVEEIMHS